MRETTKEKEKKVLSTFLRLLRSGKDFTTNFMYSEAGKPCYITAASAGNMIRKHYRKIISKEMKAFILNLKGTPHEQKIIDFSDKFGYCCRESRLMIRYINRSK